MLLSSNTYLKANFSTLSLRSLFVKIFFTLFTYSPILLISSIISYLKWKTWIMEAKKMHYIFLHKIFSFKWCFCESLMQLVLVAINKIFWMLFLESYTKA